MRSASARSPISISRSSDAVPSDTPPSTSPPASPSAAADGSCAAIGAKPPPPLPLPPRLSSWRCAGTGRASRRPVDGGRPGANVAAAPPPARMPSGRTPEPMRVRSGCVSPSSFRGTRYVTQRRGAARAGSPPAPPPSSHSGRVVASAERLRMCSSSAHAAPPQSSSSSSRSSNTSTVSKNRTPCAGERAAVSGDAAPLSAAPACGSLRLGDSGSAPTPAAPTTPKTCGSISLDASPNPGAAPSQPATSGAAAAAARAIESRCLMWLGSALPPPGTL
eukprot:18391-Chlamydomonas_euryale.AAC.1